jgi:predicted small integral membrane protein
MAWTLPTALFFIGIGCALVAMTIWQLRAPSPPRRGLLPMATTPGDRFFISLLGSAFVHIAWLAVSDGPVWIASALSALLMFIVLRWG